MGEWPAQLPLWSVCVVVVEVVICRVDACNVREISKVIQQRFREEIAAQCGSIGDKCSFDRECCKGLECSMSASHDGVGLSCQRAWLMDPDRGDMAFEMPDSSPTEPKSEDADWMTFKSEEFKVEEDHQKSTEDNNEKMYPTDMLTEIENLQEKKKLKLIRENNELEKLFTEREAKELEQLRALREDTEMDELRRLKELRLKRKMQLIKELKELRGLKAEENLNALQEFKRMNNANQTYDGQSNNNETYAIDVDENKETTPDKILDEQTQFPDPQEGGKLTKHKQGIHEVHHKRKHHHHKRKDQHQNYDSTNQTQDANPDDNETFTEYNTG